MLPTVYEEGGCQQIGDWCVLVVSLKTRSDVLLGLKFTAESAANPAQRGNLSAAGAPKDLKEYSSVYPNHPKQKKESKEKNKGIGNTRFGNRCPPQERPKEEYFEQSNWRQYW